MTSFHLKAIGDIRGDATTPYRLVFDKQMTIAEFVDEVLMEHNDEWGTISIFNPNKWGICYKYSKGKLVNKLPQEIMKRKIISATAEGGWTLMDYSLVLEAIE